MSDTSTGGSDMHAFQEGQKIWVEQSDGSQRPGIFVGEATGSWFGSTPGGYVAYPDTQIWRGGRAHAHPARDEQG